ncbi:MAG TPA: protein phosphatase 2C domain-containing protein [Leptolyngbyaceae cyanobacterium M33_DOE_097]|uniref:Serine/threonine protein phosphatase n=1 Tax=Oscillatoriales cyanobacterium SpSt-418 TaxID=2282169 RepID=A0A7C3PIW5_9CYAN|nr:protein phosphatase 2C domain-containing protein [Leptolyngbyaceae cyanobacterium M33_DOE_097]
MQNLSATIYCPNPDCQVANSELHSTCQKCGTRLPKVYLWAVWDGLEAGKPGDLLAGRYCFKSNQIVLDTQPGLVPEATENLPPKAETYLRLSPHQLHLPQVYAILKQSHPRIPGDVLLLDAAHLIRETESGLQLLPMLQSSWESASELRQLNWLWQMASLWQPLNVEGVAASLLSPDVLRVDGSLVRLVELRSDRTPPTLSKLGQLWRSWVPTAQPAIREFLDELCQQIIAGSIYSSEQLASLLDRGLEIAGKPQIRQVTIATGSDRGPSRPSNEDACYPPSGTAKVVDAREMPLVIVCDGIGGHAGGEVASNLAIATLQQHLEPLLTGQTILEPAHVMAELEHAALATNDVISQRNDNELRQERQRMGTTLVMALATDYELYLTHVGDSRAYRITLSGCQQVTVDDDLASREVRLGYATYREALRHPGSGALVQALGMASSTLLHPSVQRFMVDDDCLFLLCSDGLSDNNRVEQSWQVELLPVLQGKVDLATAVSRLVAIANTQNGHDNVTVGLVHCRVTAASLPAPLSRELALPDPANTRQEAGFSSPTAPTKLLRPRRRVRVLPALLGLLTLGGVSGVAAYFLLAGQREVAETPTPSPLVSASPSPSVTPSASLAPANLPQSLLQVTPTSVSNQEATLTLPIASPLADNKTRSVRIPAGSILKVVRQTESRDGVLYTLKLCWVTPESSARQGVGQTGDEVTTDPAAIAAVVSSIAPSNLSPEQLAAAQQYCSPLPTESSPSTQPN